MSDYAVPLRRDDDDLLRLDEVGDWLQMSDWKVAQLTKDRDRPLPIRRFGFQPRVRVGDLREWIQQTPIVGE